MIVSAILFCTFLLHTEACFGKKPAVSNAPSYSSEINRGVADQKAFIREINYLHSIRNQMNTRNSKKNIEIFVRLGSKEHFPM